jgi:hypothetical protein
MSAAAPLILEQLAKAVPVEVGAFLADYQAQRLCSGRMAPPRSRTGRPRTVPRRESASNNIKVPEEG